MTEEVADRSVIRAVLKPITEVSTLVKFVFLRTIFWQTPPILQPGTVVPALTTQTTGNDKQVQHGQTAFGYVCPID